MSSKHKSLPSLSMLKFGKRIQMNFPPHLYSEELNSVLFPKISMDRSKNTFLKILLPPPEKEFQKKWFIKRIVLLIIFIWISILAILLGVDKPIVAAFLLIAGIVSQAFAAVLALIGLIPIIGPTLVWALSLPVVWLMNALGYVVSIKMVSQGKGKEILNWRTVALVFIIGTAIGIVIGRFLP